MVSTKKFFSEEIIEKVTRELFISTPLHKADLLFVFGTRHSIEKFASAICVLWYGGFFRWLVITGGSRKKEQVDEATLIFEKIKSIGIPHECVFLEKKALHTGQNVEFSLPILDQNIGLKNIQSVIAMGKHCASARYLMTLEKHWPSVEKMLLAVNHFDIPDADWHRYPLTRARVSAEWEKLALYKRLGYIVDWHGTRHQSAVS
nr:ElyC/SanA/YdcF family protein [Robbsia betulipollinis]